MANAPDCVKTLSNAILKLALDSDYNPSYDVLMPDAMPPGARPKESDAHAEMKALWLVARRALLLIVAEFDRHFGIDGKADKLSHPN